jgi:hypothetical protein
MARAAASLSNSGIRPSVTLVAAIQFPEEGWRVLLGLERPVEALPASGANAATFMLAAEGESFWQSLAVAQLGENRQATWFLGGTLPDWGGAPLAIAALVEENNPTLAQRVGRVVLRAAMTPVP